MRPPRRFYVYIMSNGPRSATLYTGITGNLTRRVWQHKNHLIPGFASRYNLTRLIYYEAFVYPDAAIMREKAIKGWRREKKMRLVQSMNPQWNDLAADWADIHKPGRESLAPLEKARSFGMTLVEWRKRRASG
jgi:putative endonuclease